MFDLFFLIRRTIYTDVFQSVMETREHVRQNVAGTNRGVVFITTGVISRLARQQWIHVHVHRVDDHSHHRQQGGRPARYQTPLQLQNSHNISLRPGDGGKELALSHVTLLGFELRGFGMCLGILNQLWLSSYACVTNK